ncbi:ribonuclease H-like domain-containing protein, partial [Tanacetum coccineum]
TSYSLPPAETGYSLPPEGTSYSLPPEGASYSLPLEGTSYSLPPEGVSYSLPLKGTSCSLSLEGTNYPLPLEETSYSLVIAFGPEVAFIILECPTKGFLLCARSEVFRPEEIGEELSRPEVWTRSEESCLVRMCGLDWIRVFSSRGFDSILGLNFISSEGLSSSVGVGSIGGVRLVSFGDIDLILSEDMHTYISRLKDTELETLIATYDILLDLRPCLPDPNFRMINLPARDTAIGIYSRIFDSLGVRIPFSSFLLAVLKYFKVHISQLVPLGLSKAITLDGDWFSFAKHGDHAPVCMEVAKSELKLWKEKFFLIDCRAIPFHMPWRHPDSCITDKVPTIFNQNHVDELKAVEKLSRVHSTFHVSKLKKCLADEPLAIPLDEIQVEDKSKQSRIPNVKVRWNSRRGPDFTWEREDQMQKKYPHLFTNSAPTAEVMAILVISISSDSSEDSVETLAGRVILFGLLSVLVYFAFFSLSVIIVGPSSYDNTELINYFDASNPLHIQTTDNSNIALIPFKLLGTENYRIWLNGIDALYLKMFTWVLFILIMLLLCRKSLKALMNSYDKVDGSIIFNLLQKINMAKQGGSYVTDYYHRVNSLWREFDALTKLPKCIYEVKCSCDASKESALLTRDPLPEVKDAFTTVSRKESHRGIPESSGVSESKLNATSFAAKSFNNNRRSFNNDNNNTSNNNMQNLLSLINDCPSSSIHANMAGWIIDSSANQHLTMSTIGMSTVVDITSLNITVGHPNRTLAIISHVGNLRLTSNVILYDVLVVPSYFVSLMSVNKLIRDSKMFVGFDENKCCIQDLKREKILGTDSESGGLYLFDMIKDNSIVFFVLHQYLDISMSLTISVCEVCHRAQQTRGPFPLSNHKSKKLGELVHLDLWGPYRVPNREGFKYFLTIVDDYSRAVYVYLIKTKDKTSYAHTLQQNEIVERLPSLVLKVLNNHDKLSFKSEKCVLIGYSSVKKAYKLLNADYASDTEHLTFFDNQTSQTLNDDGKATPVEDSNMQTPGVIMSTRQTKLLVKLNDYVLNSNVKYGIEKFVEYSSLRGANLCFATTLNKSVEPSCLSDYLSDPNWVDAMNNEIKALNRNNTWSECDFQSSRKPIGSKWYGKLNIKLLVKLKDTNPDLWLKDLVKRRVKHKGVVFVALLDYVDDIVIIRNDEVEINNLKRYLSSKFLIKDLGELKYLLARPISIPFPENTILNHVESKDDKYLNNFTSYHKLIGKLIYLTNIRPDVSYDVHCISQHMHCPLQSHMKAALRCPKTRKSVTGVCVFWVSLRGKVRSKLLFPRVLLRLNIEYDNGFGIQLAANPDFHEKSKHFEIDVHFVREKVQRTENKAKNGDFRVRGSELQGSVRGSGFSTRCRILANQRPLRVHGDRLERHASGHVFRPGPVWGCDRLVSRAKVIENQVMAISVISVSLDLLEDSVGTPAGRVKSYHTKQGYNKQTINDEYMEDEDDEEDVDVEEDADDEVDDTTELEEDDANDRYDKDEDDE